MVKVVEFDIQWTYVLGNHCLTRTETTLAGYSKKAIAQLLSEKINQRYLTNMKASHPHCPKFLSKIAKI